MSVFAPASFDSPTSSRGKALCLRQDCAGQASQRIPGINAIEEKIYGLKSWKKKMGVVL
jgi:hypothetical protein